jgi:hypothetical protein
MEGIGIIGKVQRENAPAKDILVPNSLPMCESYTGFAAFARGVLS